MSDAGMRRGSGGAASPVGTGEPEGSDWRAERSIGKQRTPEDQGFSQDFQAERGGVSCALS